MAKESVPGDRGRTSYLTPRIQWNCSSLNWPPGVVEDLVRKEKFLERNFAQGHE
jgi:hypothetical protein